MPEQSAEEMTAVIDINLNDTLKALSNPVRLNIMSWLKHPQQHFADLGLNLAHPGISVSLIQEKAQLSQSTISSYLALLSRARLVTSHRCGGWTYYKRNEEAIAHVLQLLGAAL